jgi:hypothetical protein
MQKVRKAEDIVVLLRKVEILINHGKTVLLSCKECGISDHTTIDGVENMAGWTYLKPKN